jgi:hypothetical protein
MVVSIAARKTRSNPALAMCNKLSPEHLHKLKDKEIKRFFLKKSAASLLYRKLPKIVKLANTQHICHKPVDFIQFLLTI